MRPLRERQLREAAAYSRLKAEFPCTGRQDVGYVIDLSKPATEDFAYLRDMALGVPHPNREAPMPFPFGANP